MKVIYKIMNINREKLIEALVNDVRLNNMKLCDLHEVIEIINEQEPADDIAIPEDKNLHSKVNTRGVWIRAPFSDNLTCSECGADHPLKLKEIKVFASRCPRCHALMKIV